MSWGHVLVAVLVTWALQALESRWWHAATFLIGVACGAGMSLWLGR